jgi:hypothetical protein
MGGSHRKEDAVLK